MCGSTLMGSKWQAARLLTALAVVGSAMQESRTQAPGCCGEEDMQSNCCCGHWQYLARLEDLTKGGQQSDFLSHHDNSVAGAEGAEQGAFGALMSSIG